jgi:cytochrome P450
MREYFAALIPARRRGGGSDLLSRLCRAEDEAGRQLSDTEIADHMNFLMMAAHDTTTSTLTSLLYLLGRHPRWQERVREESLALGEEFMDFERRDELDALTRCTHETLRLYPPLSTIPRLALRDCEFQGWQIPRGALVAVFPIHTHRMPEWWSEPERFDPDRFAPQRAEHQRHSHLFVPFGGGAHMCLGLRFAEMQIRAVMHQLVRRARFELPSGYTMPVQEAPISKPRDGLPIRLVPLS